MKKRTFIKTIWVGLAVWGMLVVVHPAVGEGALDAVNEPSDAQAKGPGVPSVDWRHETVQSIAAGGGDAFGTRLKALKQSELEAVALGIDAAYGEDPAAALAWLERLTTALGADGAHAQAATLVNALVVPDDLGGLERGVYERWIGQGGEGLRALLEQWARHEGAADHGVSVVASLYQAEYADQFEAYLAWIEQSPDALKGVLVQNLVPHLRRTHFGTVEALVVAHLDHGPFTQALYTLTERRAEEDAADTLAWVATIQVPQPHLGIKMEAFGLVIRTMARADIDAAAAVLKQPSFIATYFPTSRVRMTDASGDWSELARWFHDESWRHFVEAVLDSHPKRAEEASLLFYNPQLLKDYRELFRDTSS